MPEYLVFQLYGPFMSWGDIAVGEMRPSAMMPAKSAILGLLAAAVGIKRPEYCPNLKRTSGVGRSAQEVCRGIWCCHKDGHAGSASHRLPHSRVT